MARHARNAKGQFKGFGRKHKKNYGRKHRSKKGFGALPSLSDLKSSANGMDVLMGVGVGLLGAAGARWAMNKLNETETLNIDTAGVIYQGSPLIGAIIAGAILHSWKKGETKATGWLVGAVASGLGIVGYEQVMPRVAPSLFGYSGVLAPENYAGVLAADNYGAMDNADPLDAMALQSGLDTGEADAIESLLTP